jgi:hypothetical protein
MKGLRKRMNPFIRIAHLGIEFRTASHYTVTLGTGSILYTKLKHPLPTPGIELQHF